MKENLPMPVATRCQNCGNTAAETVCHVCKTPKSVPINAPMCRYFPNDNCDCDCGGRGFCLIAA